MNEQSPFPPAPLQEKHVLITYLAVFLVPGPHLLHLFITVFQSCPVQQLSYFGVYQNAFLSGWIKRRFPGLIPRVPDLAWDEALESPFYHLSSDSSLN